MRFNELEFYSQYRPVTITCYTVQSALRLDSKTHINNNNVRQEWDYIQLNNIILYYIMLYCIIIIYSIHLIIFN